ncbi:MAG TPA: contractile injection system tape measure protein, partial [Longimicrobium sp.]|nr:contractile injection system tape measure protein [Longimicrobium sp.]
SPDALRHALERMVDEAPGEIVPFLRRHAADRRARERWVRVLPERALARLAGVLQPRRHDTLLRTAEMLDAAWQDTAPPGHAALTGRRAFWGFLLRFLARNAGADRLTDRLVAAYFADRAARCRRLSPAPDLPAIGARLLEAAGRVAGARGHARLHAVLHRRRRRLLAAWAPPSAAASGADVHAGTSGPRARPPSAHAQAERPNPPRGRRRPPAVRFGAVDNLDDGEPVYVANAGLVLASPFLPHLFASLGLLGEGEDGRPRLRDAEAVSRGVHLLQYLVDGRTDTPEPALALNKVLCGVPLATPVDASIQMTGEEQATCDQLLAAMLARWEAIRGTSVAGLRETFLQREGRLNGAEGGWKLTVQRKTVDVLVDQVPWSISVVLHRWMPAPLHVTW